MFTGLVEAIGELTARTDTPAGYRLRVRTALAPELTLGDSVAVNGVCLTVVALDADELSADVGPETARVTTLGSLAIGAAMNLERPLRADGRFGGHFVQGHVDAVGRVEELRPDADFLWLTVGFPSTLAPLFVNKGSVAVDGISLTVAGLATDRFTSQIVPFTMMHTNVGRMRLHDAVNLECDMVGKYVARAIDLAAPGRGVEAAASKDLL
jgi:riboflavin synthase